MKTDKQEFEEWALTKPDFHIRSGELKFFGFPFWKLEKRVQKPVIEEYKQFKNK